MFCPRCATVNQDDSKFCLKCGQSLAAGAKVVPLKRKQSLWYLAIVIPCALLMFFVVLSALGSPQEQGNVVSDEAVPALAQTSSAQTSSAATPSIEASSVASSSVEASSVEASSAETSSEQVVSELSQEEYKAQCKKVSFKTIARDSNGLSGEKFTFTGEVIQVMEPTLFSDVTTYRVNVTKNEYGFYEDTIIVEFRMPEGADRILDGDIIKLWGESTGLYTYQSVLGANITLPSIRAKYIGIVGQ